VDKNLEFGDKYKFWLVGWTVDGRRDPVDRREATKVNSRSDCDIDENGKRRFTHVISVIYRSIQSDGLGDLCFWDLDSLGGHVCASVAGKECVRILNENHEARGKRQDLLAAKTK
jgi:hypothetical protein